MRRVHPVKLLIGRFPFRFLPNSKVGQEFMIKLKYLIQETYELNGDRKVMLVAHSMGNTYLTNFFRKMDQVNTFLNVDVTVFKKY